MSHPRPLIGALIAMAILACFPAAAKAAACDDLRFFSLHTAEKNAWDTRDFKTLNKLNLEEATYADACGHKETGDDRRKILRLAYLHYMNVGSVELGKKQFGSAKRHFLRAEAIVAELRPDAKGDELDEIKHREIFIVDGIRRANKHISTAA